MPRTGSYLRKVLWEIDLPTKSKIDSIHLDFGSGQSPRNPFGASRLIACDILDPEQVDVQCEYVKCDVVGELPFESNFFSSVSAYDVLEHIPRWTYVDGKVTFAFVNFMNEIYRILRPGGFFYAVTPSFPASEAFTDPTHVNAITIGTAEYFGRPAHAKKPGYGFHGEFEILFAGWLKGAGPYCSQENLFDVITKRTISKDSAVAFFKLVNRYLRRSSNRSPSHCPWVFLKPMD